MAVYVGVEGPRDGGEEPKESESQVERRQWLVAAINAVAGSGGGGGGLHKY